MSWSGMRLAGSTWNGRTHAWGPGVNPGSIPYLLGDVTVPASVSAALRWESGMFKVRTVVFLTSIDLFKFPISPGPHCDILYFSKSLF